MTTVNEAIDNLIAEFRKLSESRQRKLAKDARLFINQNPGCGDNNGFWRFLSARQVLAAYYGNK